MTRVKQRTWTKVGERFTRGKRDKVGKMMDRITWHKLPYTMGAMPGMAIKAAIKQLRLPKVSHVASSHEMAPYGLLGIAAHYKGGVAHIYLVDTGVDVVPIASDYYPDTKSNPTLSIPVVSRKQWGHLFDAQESLSKAGVTFDSGTSFKDHKPKTRDWELDWSLKGAEMRNPMHPFICGQCGWRFPTMARLNTHLKRQHPEAYASYGRNPLGLIGAGLLSGVGLGVGFSMVNWGKKRLLEKNPGEEGLIPDTMEAALGTGIGYALSGKQVRHLKNPQRALVFHKGTKKDGCRKVIQPGEQVANRWGRILCRRCDAKKSAPLLAVYSAGVIRPEIFQALGRRKLQCGDTLISQK